MNSPDYTSSSTSESEQSLSPIPSFDASGISLSTISPALGVPSSPSTSAQPDYLDYDTKGRGIMTTMFANTGLSYMLGTVGGGLYGLSEGLKNTPSHRFRVKLNSVLNHCSRHGSRVGNTVGVLSIFYTFYEDMADRFEVDRYTAPLGIDEPGPALAALLTGATFKAQAGPRVAALAGSIGLAGVGVTYGVYTVLGIPHGHKGWLFF